MKTSTATSGWAVSRVFGALLLAAAFTAGPDLPQAKASEDSDLARQVAAAQIPVEASPEALRGKIKELIARPAVFARGPAEAFPCKPDVYEWMLDHPDWAYAAWKVLGAKCATIERLPDGSFKGKDNLGGEVRWQTVLAEPGRRVWYAEGAGRAAPLTPLVTVRAVLLLNYDEVKGRDGRLGIRHRAEVFAICDGKAAALVTKLMGMTADQAARKTLSQLELFFSGMSWYVCEKPDWAATALKKHPATADLLKITPPAPAVSSIPAKRGPKGTPEIIEVPIHTLSP